MKNPATRRQVMLQAGTLACGAVAFAQPDLALSKGGSTTRVAKGKVEEVSPVEDLMRERRNRR